MSQARILILSAKYGEGHFQAGEALAQKIKAKWSSQVEVSHLDFGHLFFKKTDYFLRTAYTNMVTKTPEIWRLIFEKTINSHLSGLKKFVSGVGCGTLMNYFQDFSYDLIVCTHFIPAGILAEYKRKRLLTVPLVTVITDYLVHGIWIYPEVDLYLVGSSDASFRLQKAGIHREKILLTGIPLRPGFDHKLPKEESKKQLGLCAEKKTVLVMGGSAGHSGKEFEILDSLRPLAETLPVQFLFVCGSDQDLYRELASKIKKDPAVQARIYGYVHNIPQLMAASDLLITKGGALTISEALSSGLPLIMYKPIPGHENGNAAFVVKGGAGVKVTSPQELRSSVKYLLQNPDKLTEMSSAAVKLLPPQAADKAAKAVLGLVEDQGFKNKVIV
ncbi:MAG TPA: glycosyltransferase [Peptococcaceae bacterium]|nr:glycosyltransferase [Peptococcaceae bacterium]